MLSQSASSRRVRDFIAVLAVAAAIAAVPSVSAAATSQPRQPVTITNVVSGDVNVISGPFTTTGPLCTTGTSETTGRTVLSSGDGYLNLFVAKHFTCDDGSGTFDLGLLVHLTFGPFTDTFVWAVTGGTGAYEHLHGFGTGTGALQPDGSLVDSYRGFISAQ